MKASVYARIGLVVAGFLSAGFVLAQASDAEVVSFGKRAPSVAELQKAFAPPPSSELQGMGLSQPTQAVRKSIDMELFFDFGSADISSKSKAQLATLGEYLQTAKIGQGEFHIEGHTDGVGSLEANRNLSARRAQAVKNFLVSEYRINANALTVAGLGDTQLKDPGNPSSEINRRVAFSVTYK
jgi:outer membrane protein OmpA-like peptidoglycan-associated protein